MSDNSDGNAIAIMALRRMEEAASKIPTDYLLRLLYATDISSSLEVRKKYQEFLEKQGSDSET
jgi:hypothetical protein